MNEVYMLILAICQQYQDKPDDFIISTGNQVMVMNPMIGQELPEIHARISETLGNYRLMLKNLEILYKMFE